MTITQVSHTDTLTNSKEIHHMQAVDEFDMPTNEIEMYEHREEIELPTNGLDEFIDWDGLERSLLAGGFSCQRDFRLQVQAQFEAVERPYSRGWYRAVIKGLLPEYREIYSALPAHMEMVA